ncbi:hypothetical protein KEM60_02826 [Austwickia sp. TVS 96-490-7B]|uniref:glycosyltransferase 87 family protein n=1 Tax=Austwickia sp. TVS 96-490-7B TaxID=2830843 RepID=UPI001C58F7E5|nr:glycosyltransferase 87 family protein [Austwickia sp. TVS 96-490-7B]MBW3086598.1 hypothetical protein [Austwickia sp. TVS 96-490-7B]
MSSPTAPSAPDVVPSVGRARATQVLWILIAAAAMTWTALHGFSEYQVAQSQDFLVYKHAGDDIAAGIDPYRRSVGLPYTYPPALGLAFVPLSVVPDHIAVALSLAVNAILTCFLLGLLLRPRTGWSRPGRSWTSSHFQAAALAVVLAGSAPFIRSVYLGQFNLVLFALLLADMLLTGRAAGLGTGLAASIKVTPAAMGLVHLVRGRWAAVVLSLVSFLAVGAATYVLAPDLVTEYWLQLLWDPSRVGNLSYVDNQSVTGFVARLTSTDAPSRLLVWVLLVPLTLLTLGTATVSGRSADRWQAPLAVGLFALFFSPVSWSHHWIWLVVFVAWTWRRGRVTEAAILAVLLVPEPLLFDEHTRSWPALPTALVTSTYFVLGCYAAIRLAHTAHRDRRRHALATATPSISFAGSAPRTGSR